MIAKFASELSVSLQDFASSGRFMAFRKALRSQMEAAREEINLFLLQKSVWESSNKKNIKNTLMLYTQNK